MRFSILTVTFLFSFYLCSQVVTETPNDIFRSLATTDTVSGAKVRVFQDSKIENSLVNRRVNQIVKTGTGAGFRIQVFSSNVQRTAKAEAFEIEKEIRNVFPELGVYVSYISPFWKVRVGDFRTSSDAQAFQPELISAFPNLKKAIYTVKEKINY